MKPNSSSSLSRMSQRQPRKKLVENQDCGEGPGVPGTACCSIVVSDFALPQLDLEPSCTTVRSADP